MSHVFFSERIKALSDETLQLEFRRVYELSNGKVLWCYLVDTELLLLVDVACYDGFYELLAIDVHWQHLVVLTAHYHVALAALHPCVELIVALAKKP